MAENVRERFVIDLGLEEAAELSQRERDEIASKLSSLAHTVAIGVLAPDRVRVIHPGYKARYAHRHESTADQSCRYCVAYSDDELNSENIDD